MTPDPIVTTCETCLSQIDPILIHACASSGIEHKKPTYQVMNEYLQDFHDRGHKSP